MCLRETFVLETIDRKQKRTNNWLTENDIQMAPTIYPNEIFFVGC